MPLDLNVFISPTFGAKVCRMLIASTRPDAETACKREWLFNDWGGADLVHFPTRNLLPSAIAGVNDEQIFVGISGTDSVEQVQHYGNPSAIFGDTLETRVSIRPGEVTAYTELRQFVVNTAFWEWGTIVVEMVEAADGREGRTPIFTGHSYGGAVAMAAAIQYKVRHPGTKVYCLTFGAPKLGGSKIVGLLNRCTYLAWINENDPVPALPPSEGEIGFPLSFVWRGVAYGVGPWYRFQGPALKLDRNGQFTPGVPDNLTPTILQLVRHLGDRKLLLASPAAHKLAAYLRRLQLWSYTPPPGYALSAPLVRLLAAPFPQGFPGRLIAQRTQAIEAAKADDLRRSAESAGLVSVSSPTNGHSLFSGGNAMPFVPAQYIAKKAKLGEDWVLQWEGSVIARGTRSECLSLQKVLNHFLRRAQVMSEFSLTDFSATAAIYFSEASAGGLGFKPDVLHVT